MVLIPFDKQNKKSIFFPAIYSKPELKPLILSFEQPNHLTFSYLITRIFSWECHRQNMQTTRKVLKKSRTKKTLLLIIKEKTVKISRIHKEERGLGKTDTHRVY